MTTATLARELVLGDVPNARHIGGYRAAEGRRTSERIIRSAGLHHLTAETVSVLRDMGVATVLDLRSGKEREEFVTPDLGPHDVRHVFAPVFESDASPVGLAEEFPGYRAIYPKFLETGREAYRILADTLSDTDGGFLYHCAVGKDRTGVATALLLELVGVADDEILDDYSHSARLLAPMLEKWKAGMKERGLDPNRAEEMMASNPADIASLLVHLRDRWGDAEGYFLDIGVTSATLTRVRERVLA
ncbi:MAG: tyrosine-protein phosphatase [Dehalococcoidia bacterium]